MRTHYVGLMSQNGAEPGKREPAAFFVSLTPQEGRIRAQHTIVNIRAMAAMLRGGTREEQFLRGFYAAERGISLDMLSGAFSEATALRMQARLKPQLVEDLPSLEGFTGMLARLEAEQAARAAAGPHPSAGA